MSKGKRIFNIRGTKISASAAVAVAALIFGSMLHAQIAETATIAGTVVDRSGAVVAGASVLVIDEATGATTRTETESTGAYAVSNLTVDNYTVTIQKNGFKTYTVKGNALHPTITTTVNAILQVGTASENVTVTAAPAEVQTLTPEVSSSIEAEQVSTLPMNGRNVSDLALLMPGTLTNNMGTMTYAGGRIFRFNIESNGGGTTNTVYYIDGVWNENSGNMAQPAILPNPDSIEEVRMLQNNYSAKYTTMGVTEMVMETKSGSSQFHGNAWEFVRNNDFNAKNYFATVTPPFKSPVLPLKQNNFGFNVGGPAYIPKIYNTNRQKTFFFWDESWWIMHQSSPELSVVPTANQRAGCFSSPINNPATGTLFPVAVSGSPCPVGDYVVTPINPNSAALLKVLMPTPNYSTATNANNFNDTNPIIVNQRDDEVKINHSFSPKLSFMAEYMKEHQIYNYGYEFSYNPTNYEADTTNNRVVTGALTYVISPTMVNRMSWSAEVFWLNLLLYGPNYLNQVPGYSESLPYTTDIYSGGPLAQGTRVPQIGISGFVSFGANTGRPYLWNENQAEIVSDDWSWLRGRHYLQAGGMFWWQSSSASAISATNGSFSFDASYTGETSAEKSLTGVSTVTADAAMAAYLLGDATSFTQAANAVQSHPQSFSITPYAEDQVKLTKNLTVTAGVRLFYMPLAYNRLPSTNFLPYAYSAAAAPASVGYTNGVFTPGPNYNYLNGLISDTTRTYKYLVGTSVLNGSIAAGLPKGFFHQHDYRLAPVAGFAWDIFGDGKTSLRGGYGITYFRIWGNTQDCSNCYGNRPETISESLTNVGFPNVTGGNAPAFGIGSLTAADQNIQLSSAQGFSLSLQHQFPGNWFASVAGAGDLYRHVATSANINQAPHYTSGGVSYDFNPAINFDATCNGAYAAGAGPGCTPTQYYFSPYQGYSNISTYETWNTQDWEALELQLKHEFSNGLMVNANYTWSKDTYNTPLDPYNVKRWSGNLEGVNTPQILGLSVIYKVPFFQHGEAIARTLLGGWQYSDTTSYRSGTSTGPGLSMSHQGIAMKPDRGSGPLYCKSGRQWFNNYPNNLAGAGCQATSAAWQNPQPGYYGNAGLGPLFTPHLIVFNMALYKDFRIVEGHTLQFRAEAFNTFNHTNFTGVSTTFGSANYGQLTGAADPRILEFALKYKF